MKPNRELTRGPEQDHLAIDVQLLHGGFGSTSDCHARNTNQIVAACVTDPRERIHLRVDTEDAPPSAVCVGGYPGCFEQIVFLNVPSLCFQELCVRIMGITSRGMCSASRHRVPGKRDRTVLRTSTRGGLVVEQRRR